MKKHKGFTLVELLVVIAIIAVLVAIAAIAFSKATRDAAITAHNSNVRTLQSAAVIYEIAENKSLQNFTKTELVPRYLQDWPVIPKSVRGQIAQTEINSTQTAKIAETAEYKVYKKNGEIKVSPGYIKE